MEQETSGILAWHFLADDGMTTAYPERPAVRIEVGQTLREERPLALCQVGLHASRRALDALQYAPGTIVCRVRLSGTVVEGGNKLCASERTVLAMADAAALLREFACWCAEKALQRERAAGREPDPLGWAALEAKRRSRRGEASLEELIAVRDATWAARDATGAADWATAWAAARADAWADARVAQNAELERRLKALLGVD